MKQWCLNLVSVDSGMYYYKVRVSWKINETANFSAYWVFMSLKCLEICQSRKIKNHCSAAFFGCILSRKYRFELLFQIVSSQWKSGFPFFFLMLDCHHVVGLVTCTFKIPASFLFFLLNITQYSLIFFLCEMLLIPSAGWFLVF